jgi:hypothetical protein
MREKRSLIVKWKFSTNRVIIKGSNGFDYIFGPGNESKLMQQMKLVRNQI